MSEFAIKKVKPVKKPSILGDKNPRWNGGLVFKRGRVMVYSPDHPYPTTGRYVYRHRLIMEEHLGRYLKPSEVVHHINHDHTDDRLENLQVMSVREHNLHHATQLKRSGRWARDYERCVGCGTVESEHKGHGLCTRCTDRKRWPFRKLKEAA